MPENIDTVKGNVIEQNLGTIIQNIISEPKNQIETQVVYNLVGFGGKVYGRVGEAKILGDALCGKDDFASKQFFLIVAPSGFGKSFLLTKTLQDVTDGTIVKPAYEQIVQRIIRLDCRNTKSITDIVSQFTNVIGLSFGYPQDFSYPFEYLNGVLFHYLRKIGRIWLILDNFESWLDGENDYQPVNEEIEVFLKALFEGNHTLRGVFLSQSPPVNFIKQKIKTLETIDENLYQGLPKDDALLMLREGEGVDFSDVTDELLIEFLEKVAYIPQAINSLLGYMQDGATLDEVLHIPEFQEGFEKYESDAERVEAGERRTNALIARQINAQSDSIQLLLQALTYFGKRLPFEALELLFEDKPTARNAINRLKTHRLASENKDLSGTYYDLHAYFRRQTKIVLPDFDRITDDKYAYALINVGNKIFDRGFLQKASDLYECAGIIYRHLFNQGRSEAEIKVARTKINQGLILHFQGKMDEAIALYDETIKTLEPLVNEHGQDNLADDLALAYTNKGETLRRANKFKEAADEQDKAIKIRERLVNELKKEQFANDLANSYMCKGNALSSLGELDEGIVNYDNAIKIRKRLVNELKQDKFADDLAKALWGRGTALDTLEEFDKAIESYNEAIEILERLVKELGQNPFADYLASVYMNKGISLSSKNELDEAVECFDNCEKIRQSYLLLGQYQILPNFIGNIRNRVKVLLKQKNWERTANDVIAALDFKDSWENIEISDYFKQEIERNQIAILMLLLAVSSKNRKEIYKHAGEYGEIIKQLVQSLENNSPKA
jgi:tetratricopeptide (TPR) repeat protein